MNYKVLSEAASFILSDSDKRKKETNVKGAKVKTLKNNFYDPLLPLANITITRLIHEDVKGLHTFIIFLKCWRDF